MPMRSDQSHLSRRNLFRSLAFGGAGVLLFDPSWAFAQPAAPTVIDRSLQGAGFFTFQHGEATVSVVSDGGFVMKPGEVFPDVPKAELEQVAKAAHVSTEGFPGQINTLLVRRGNDVILIDAGSGRNFGPTAGFLLPNLSRAGVAPADVTHVVLSHAHPDHVGGLLTADGKPTFARAKIFANKAEYEFWTGPDPKMPDSLVPPDFQKVMINAATTAFAGVKDSLEIVKPDDTIGGLVKLIDAPGHTPGHVALRVGAADGPHLLYLGDALFILPLQLKHLDWHAMFDADPVAAAITRRKLLDMAAEGGTLATASHLPYPSLGYFDREGDGFRWTPRPWTW
jgi:glyoxylase-like metal-dependent hydrolase (beta-lactamase superfamily II)